MPNLELKIKLNNETYFRWTTCKKFYLKGRKNYQFFSYFYYYYHYFIQNDLEIEKKVISKQKRTGVAVKRKGTNYFFTEKHRKK